MKFPIIEFLKEWWTRYQAQKKSDILYNKLHKYDVDGKTCKFSQKDAIKAARAAYKNKMKKDLDIQRDAKK